MKNLNTKYLITALIPLFMLAGCKRQEHKNIITGKIINDQERLFVLSDVQTGQKRVFSWSKNSGKSRYEYLNIGDTVSIFTGGGFLSEDVYQKYLILRFCEIGFECNADSILARKERAERILKTKKKEHEICRKMKEQKIK